MKSLILSAILLLVFTAIVNAKPNRPPPPPKVKEALQDCLKELGLAEKDYHERKMKGDYKNEDCLQACAGKKLGLIGADGKIDKEMAVRNFPPHVPKENATRIVDQCYEQKGENECQTAVLYENCFRKLVPMSPMQQNMERVNNECKTELKITDDDLKKMAEAKDDMKEDCFLYCFGSKLGFLNKDGTLNKENVLKEAPPHLKESVGTKIDECSKSEAVGAKECETAFRVVKCLQKNDFRDLFHGGPPKAE